MGANEMDVVFSRDHFHDAAERGDSHVAIAPARARLELQTRVCIEMHGVRKRNAQGAWIVGHLAFGIVAQPRSVIHELPDGGRLLRSMHGLLFLHLNAPIFGQVTFHGLPQLELALLHQHHRGHASEIFGHGHDLENRVGLHGLFVFDVAPAYRFKQRDVSMASHQRDGAGNLLVVHQGLEPRPDGLQAARIEAAFRLPRRSGRCGRKHEESCHCKRKSHDGRSITRASEAANVTTQKLPDRH